MILWEVVCGRVCVYTIMTVCICSNGSDIPHKVQLLKFSRSIAVWFHQRWSKSYHLIQQNIQTRYHYANKTRVYACIEYVTSMHPACTLWWTLGKYSGTTVQRASWYCLNIAKWLQQLHTFTHSLSSYSEVLAHALSLSNSLACGLWGEGLEKD